MIARRARFPIAVTIGVWPCIHISACMRAVLAILFYVIILTAPLLSVKKVIVDYSFFPTAIHGFTFIPIFPILPQQQSLMIV
jgi:hypothetical protein